MVHAPALARGWWTYFPLCFRARVYAFKTPKKAFTPSHRVCFSLIFIRFKCEGLRFSSIHKHSQSLSWFWLTVFSVIFCFRFTVSWERWPFPKKVDAFSGMFSSVMNGFYTVMGGAPCVKYKFWNVNVVKALKSKPSHLKLLKISGKRTLCERVKAFFGN